MGKDQFALETAKLLLSWPVLTTVLIIIAFRSYSKEIRKFLGEVTNLKFGTFEAGQRQPVPPGNNYHESKTQAAGLSDSQNEIKLWQFKYLSLYLVPNSKYALSWISQQGGVVPLKFYTDFNLAYNPPNNTAEKQAILNALHSEGLITINTAMIQVTPLGQEFLKFAGLLQ